jgi:hypothetical protein
VELKQRLATLRATLGFLTLEPRESELCLLHRCFDTWRGIGDVVAGMARQEYDLELRRYDGQGWRAMFFPSGFEHSLTAHAGAGWALSPWSAVQQAATNALIKLESDDATRRDWTLRNEVAFLAGPVTDPPGQLARLLLTSTANGGRAPHRLGAGIRCALARAMY